MKEPKKYFCNDCQRSTWSTVDKGCKHCESKNLIPYVEGLDSQTKAEDAKKAKDEIERLEKEDKKFLRGCAILALTVLVILFFMGQISITFDGCTLPVDIVIVDTCLFGSFGGSVGATIAATVFFAILAFLGKVLLSLFKK